MDLLFWGWTFYWQAATLYKRAYPHDRMMDNVTVAMMYVQRRWMAQLIFSPTELTAFSDGGRACYTAVT